MFKTITKLNVATILVMLAPLPFYRSGLSRADMLVVIGLVVIAVSFQWLGQKRD